MLNSPEVAIGSGDVAAADVESGVVTAEDSGAESKAGSTGYESLGYEAVSDEAPCVDSIVEPVAESREDSGGGSSWLA
jgi:hypothetical protein